MRIDLALVARGLARSRSHARQLIDSGRVSVDSTSVVKPSMIVGDTASIQVITDPYVSRAAHKLIRALDQSGLPVPSRVLDAGASTGGFTQVVLERGASRVYAVDVGHGQIADALRDDPRVTVREGLNLRDLSLDDVDSQTVDLAVADLSFISLTLVIDRIFAVLSPTGTALLLVKPQFEVGRAALDSRGVVREESDRVEAVNKVAARARELGWVLAWQAESCLPGEKGNHEVFCRFDRGAISVLP